MERLEKTAGSGVVVLDASVVHDMAVALTGDWQPEAEPDANRRDQLVAAARIRLYADRDQYGWHLVAMPAARDEAMGYTDATWSVGFVQDALTLEDAPPPEDVAGLEKLMIEGGLTSSSASALAYAVLHDLAIYVITANPSDLQHQRAADLPARLEVIDAVEAVNRLALVSGEIPLTRPRPGSPLDAGPHWWVP